MLKKLQKLFFNDASLPLKFEDEDTYPAFVPQNPDGSVVSIDPYRSRFWQDSIQEWMNQIPEEIRPVSLNLAHPRVVAKLMTHWFDQTAVEAYLFDLLVDQRGNRRGFAMPVILELRALQKYVTRYA